jgi:hypothetical protein
MNPKTMKRTRLNKETVRSLTSRDISRNQLARVAGGAIPESFYCSNWISCTWITCGTTLYGNCGDD